MWIDVNSFLEIYGHRIEIDIEPHCHKALLRLGDQKTRRIKLLCEHGTQGHCQIQRQGKGNLHRVVISCTWTFHNAYSVSCRYACSNQGYIRSDANLGIAKPSCDSEFLDGLSRLILH
jgi:hypothetical protein